MKLLIMFLLLFTGCTTQVRQDHEIGKVESLTFETARLHNKRDPQSTQWTALSGNQSQPGQREYWTHQSKLHLDLNLLTTGPFSAYWTQEVAGATTNKQYREVYWDFEFGINLRNSFDFFWHHKSEHLLDHEDRAYPIEDSYGLRLCIIGPRCKR